MEGGITENKKAYFDYEIFERIEAGIVLTGHETKSIRSGHINLAGAHAIIRGSEAFILNMQIPSFQPENAPEEYDPARTRKLLLTKKEILYISGKIKGGLTLIPLKVYSKRRLLKIELGLARGRKKHDKREIIKKRETEREIRKREGL